VQYVQQKKAYVFVALGLFMLFVAVAVLVTPTPVKAQCGSQASSCQNCHEVQAQKSVNKDGTKWHESHAFGDFCAFCHAGNQQATDKATAHQGMVPPLSDIKASCQACHAADLQQRAKVYTDILKIDLDKAGTPAAAATQAATESAVIAATATPAPVVAQPVAGIPGSNDLVVDDASVVDYVQRYNEIVLGQRPTNWGDVILVALIALVAIGGAGFVVANELKISNTRAATRKVEGEYPVEVVEMLPAIAALKPQTRGLLSNILKQPQKTEKVMKAVNDLIADEKPEK